MMISQSRNLSLNQPINQSSNENESISQLTHQNQTRSIHVLMFYVHRTSGAIDYAQAEENASQIKYFHVT